MYRKFIVNAKDAIEKRSGTDGYQPKFTLEDNTLFLKVQCKLSGHYIDDWRVEDIASRVCEQLGFYAVKQLPCNVVLNTTPRLLYGVYSNNFESKGKVYKSFESLLNLHNSSLQRNEEYNSLNNINKMKWIANRVSNYIPSIKYIDYLDYLIKLAIVDIIVCNVDRHPRNIGYIYNSVTGKEEIAPIFDCGMGLFQNDIWFKNLQTYQECLSYCYIEPYSEDPFKLLEDLDSAFNVREKIRNKTSNLKISKNLFPSEKAYSYVKEVTKRLGVCVK